MTQVFSFAKVTERAAREQVYAEIGLGKSRFGMWDQSISLADQYYGPNDFLLRIKAGDWIVHVNCPNYGRCVAVRVAGTYDFDGGLECSWGTDFCNYIPNDPRTIVEFDRNDPRIVPSVNLRPMRRGQRILEVEDFLNSVENLKQRQSSSSDKGLRGVVHLREKMNSDILPRIANYIHTLNRSKEFEHFLYEIFDNMPNVEAIKNGFGWRTDHGADLIIDFQNPIASVSLKSRLIVQAKSYTGDHHDLNAIDQIVAGIQEYRADAGLLVTTANPTEELEDYARLRSDEVGFPIDIIAGSEVARFVLQCAPDMLIGRIEA